MKNLMKRTNIGGVLALLLLCIFAVCILSVLLTGADAFQRLRQRDQIGYDRRTAAQYITTRLHQSDSNAGAELMSFEDVTALTFAEEIDGEVYYTRVYFYDGYIRELFSSADAHLVPGDGEKIMAAKDLVFMKQDGLITAVLKTTDGETVYLRTAVRSGREA